jgi:hypothetical protein
MIEQLTEKALSLNLGEELEKFLKERIEKEVSSLDKHNFSFRGSDHSRRCKGKEPHVPHQTGCYQTVRAGMLDNFCLGREGEVEGRQLNIVVTHYTGGDAESATVARGFYYFL